MSPESHGLPGVLGEIATVAGLEAAVELMRAYGGTEVYLPHRPKPNHWLVKCVGRPAADAICEHFMVRDADGRAVGNFRLLIPLGPTGALAQIRRNLRRELQSGEHSVAEVARRVGVHERTAWRHKAKLQHCADDEPQDLFAILKKTLP